MSLTTLTLPVSVKAELRTIFPTYELALGDGYTANEPAVSTPIDEWSLTAPALTELEAQTLRDTLNNFGGVNAFQWTPYTGYPIKNYFCTNYTFVPQGENSKGKIYSFSATFKQDVESQCTQLLETFPAADLLDMLAGAELFLATYTRNTKPLMVNSDGVSVNSFHDVLGRGGYFPASAGTTEGQAVGIRAAIIAYQETGDVSWLNHAISLGNAAVQYYYRINTPTTGNENTLYIPHWLINSKESFPSKGPVVDPPISSGYFNTVISFVNGEATIPGGLLADVYKVHSLDGSLLWQNVYAPLIEGTEYPVNYWVSNLELDGTNYRFTPDYASSSGPPISETVETAGFIKLTSTYTGDAIVVYSDYSGATIAKSELFDPYPFWRSLGSGESLAAFDAFPWLYDAYNLLYIETNNDLWRRAAEATKFTTITTADIENVSYFYKKENYPTVPLRWPGSQVIFINNTNEGTVSRVSGGDKNQFLRVDINAPSDQFPSVEVQNFAAVVTAQQGVQIFVECECSQDTVLEIILSTNSDAFNSTELYKTFLVVQANTLRSRSFDIKEFVRWATGFDLGDPRVGGDQKVAWYPKLVGNPTYTYTDATATSTLAESSYNDSGVVANVLVSRLVLDKTGGTYAGAGLVIVDGSGDSLGVIYRSPPKVVFKSTGDTCRLLFTDSQDQKFYRDYSPSSSFVTFPGGWDTLTPVVEGSSPAGGQIKAIEFENVGTNAVTVDVYYAGDSLNKLSLPVTVYKGALVSRVDAAHTLYCGDFRPINNPLDSLPYTPGVWPFTVNSDNSIVEAWRGEPYVGYQSPYIWRKWGYEAEANNVYQFMDQSQQEYADQHPAGKIGPFAPVLNWASWDTIVTDPDGVNKFSWNGVDPNTRWAPYAFRALESAALGWALKPTDALAGRVVMRFLGYLSENYYSRNTVSPITDFPPNAVAESNYEEPHCSALILRAAIYANLAGGDPSITFPVIVHTYRHIRDQYISTGVMEGAFAEGQPTFTENSTTYNEYFFFWHVEIVEALSILHRYRDNLTIPPCGLTYLSAFDANQFDAVFYRAAYPDAQEDVANAVYPNLITHYREVGLPEGRFYYFDEDYYLAEHPEVVQAIGPRPLFLYQSAQMHFLEVGQDLGWRAHPL